HFLDESHIFLFLAQVFIMLLLARGLGEIFSRWKQPALTAEILAGILLGPTILGRFFPEIHSYLFPNDPIQRGMIETIAWLGIMFLLLDTGLEIDFSIAWRQRGNALTIALADIILPMIIAFVPAVLLPDSFLAHPEKRVIFGLFMATVMTISAMPVAARMFHDFNMLKTELGFLVVSALAVNDLIGWVLFTIILGVFLSSSVSITPVVVVFAATIGFSVFAIGLGRKISTRILAFLKGKGLKEPATSLTCVCLLGMLFGAFTEKLGIGSLYGFFIAGIVMGEAKNLSEETRGIISQMVHAVFVPLFFANIGLKVDFAANFNWWLVALITGVGIFGRYIGAWFGVTLTNVSRVNRNIVSIAHTPGGMMEIVVALVALESGLITQEVFVAIVFSAVFSCVVAGPWLAFAMSKRSAVSVLDFINKDFVFMLKSGDKESAVKELVGLV
ncbi:MAG: cation:proton antiporter, partial [Candidatus Nanoarchaeia archaeon]